MPVWPRLLTFLLLVGLVCGLYPPAEWCKRESSWSDRATRECFIANASWDADHELKAAKQSVLDLASRFPLNQTHKPDAATIFVHCTVIGSRIGGLLILDKLLNAIHYSGLGAIATTFVVAVGNVTHVPVVASQYRNTYLVTAISHLSSFYEFPTLALMQEHARRLPPQASLLYLHTKGVTRLKDRLRSYNRDIMVVYNIFFHRQCMHLLNSQHYHSTGALLLNDSVSYYAGNFFWMKAAAMTSNVAVMDLIWRWRFAAELWPLSSLASCRVFSPPFSLEDLAFHYSRSTNVRELLQLLPSDVPLACQEEAANASTSDVP